MSITVLASVRGAPGVTTTARLLAGSLASGVVVEADTSGGTLGVRYKLGRTPGMTTLAAARSTAPEAWRDHAQLADGVPVLVGPEAAQLATALWTHTGSQLAETLAASTADLVVDAGRLPNEPRLAPVLERASTLGVLLRPTTEDLVTLAQRLTELRQAGPEVGVVLVGPGEYSSGEISEQLGVKVLGALPEHARAIEVDAVGRGAQRATTRNELVRAIRSLASVLVMRMTRTPTAPNEPEAPLDEEPTAMEVSS